MGSDSVFNPALELGVIPFGPTASAQLSEARVRPVSDNDDVRSWRTSLHQQLFAPIRVSTLAELELLLLTFCTGIQDATTFPDYHAFASNQTGNTVLLALGVAYPGKTHGLFITTNIAISLSLFLAASFLTGQAGHIIGARSRPWIVACNVFQTALVFAAAAIQYARGVELQNTETRIVMSLLSIAAGSQVVLSRALAMTEISTAMATAAWVDLLIDRKLFALHNHHRTRRASFLAALVAGSFTGASVSRQIGSASAILMSGVGKALVTVMFLFNSPEEPKTEANLPRPPQTNTERGARVMLDS